VQFAIFGLFKPPDFFPAFNMPAFDLSFNRLKFGK
jgi:hypothetical protein